MTVIPKVQGQADRLPHGSLNLRLRALAAIVAILSCAPLVIATFLTPSSAGHGTHVQLGMPPCGWAMYFGKPCATCGMTTAFAHAVRLDLVASAHTQPFGLFLAILAGVVFWAAVHATITGSDAAGLLLRTLVKPRALWSFAMAGALAWAYTWATWPVA